MQAGIFGTGTYLLQVGNECAASMASSNSLSIASGEIVMQGRHIAVSATTLTIANGSQGMKRNDLCVVNYAIDASGIETASLTIIQGTAASTATDPSYTSGNILTGSTTVQVPIYRISLDSLTVATPVLLVGYAPYQHGTTTTTYGTWYWRKYPDGIAECFMPDYARGANVTMTAWGGIYYVDIASPGAYPFVFSAIPTVTAHMISNDANAQSGPVCGRSGGSTSTCPALMVFDSVSDTIGHPHFGINVKGTWA
jgi:hypothetical protein